MTLSGASTARGIDGVAAGGGRLPPLLRARTLANGRTCVDKRRRLHYRYRCSLRTVLTGHCLVATI